ncbi:MAG: response regulator, partial [Chloroflexi bacterium]|nr:response regulator [Chloroflexota bacterium]
MMELTQDIGTWRVLIVDDELDNLNLAGDFLQFSGATVFRANSGKVGLEQFELHQPNIVLLDIAMPDMDGYEVRQRLREKPNSSQVP